jgi:hypothetical protein
MREGIKRERKIKGKKKKSLGLYDPALNCFQLDEKTGRLAAAA